MKRPVVFDIDGVLADFYTGYYEVMALLKKEPPRVGVWNDFLDPQAWDIIKASREFWFSLPPLVPYSIFRRIDSLQRERDVYFATSRPGVNAKKQTELWLKCLSIESHTVIVTSKKGEFCATVGAEFMIDDKAGNAVFTAYHSPETRVFLLDAPYNQFDHETLGSKVTRIAAVSAFLEAVEGS